MERKPLIIKKYENRRLYDTEYSRYVNLDEVARMVRDGRDLRVVDAVTGEDLTRLILTQIMMEDARGPDSVFPLDMLREMIVASGKASQESALKYMKTVMEMYQNAYRFITPAVPSMGVAAAGWNQRPPVSDGSEHSEKAATRDPSSSDRVGAAGSPAGNANDVELLKRRVEELEQVLKRGARRKSATPAKKKVRRKS